MGSDGVDRIWADEGPVEVATGWTPSPVKLSRLYHEVASIQAGCDALSALYPERTFTPDGKLVGDLGEVLARELFNFTLVGDSTPGHDATDQKGRRVEIKATQRSEIALSGRSRGIADDLVVISFDFKAGPANWYQVEYYGPASVAWALTGISVGDEKPQQYRVPLSKPRAAGSTT